MIEIVPVAPPPVPVMVVVPSDPPRAPIPPPETVITAGLLLAKVVSAVTSWPFKVAVNSTAVPAGSMVRLISFPSEDVMSRLPPPPDDCPIVTVTVPVADPLDEVQFAVIVAVDELLVSAVTIPPLLTFTVVGSELLQVQDPVITEVLPSLKFPVAVNCRLCPLVCRLGLEGLMVTPVKFGLTKNPSHATPVASRHNAANPSSQASFRLRIDTLHLGLKHQAENFPYGASREPVR